MSSSITCAMAQEQLTHIKFLENELKEILLRIVDPTTSPKDAQKYKIEARKIKLTLETEITELQEQVNPFERLFNLKEQYQKQITMLETAQILETREINGEKIRGVTDIEGDFQPVPTLKEVISRLREKKELLTVKQTQGFGKIRLVPFGMSLDDLIEKYGDVLSDHEEGGTLFSARKNTNDSNEDRFLLSLNMSNPLNVSDEYRDADRTGNLVYGVTEFDIVNHGGKTKREILKQRKKRNKSGWDIIILEDNVNIPREGQGKTIGGRAQIEANKSPEQYLKLLQTQSLYRGEVGLTPEEALIHAISELVENDEVIDDYRGNGSKAYNIGGYFIQGPSRAVFGLVPLSYFVRGLCQVFLRGGAPAGSDVFLGFRSGVRV